MLLPITVLLCAHMYACVYVCACARACANMVHKEYNVMFTYYFSVFTDNPEPSTLPETLLTTQNPLCSPRLYGQPGTLYTPRDFTDNPEPSTLPETLQTTQNPLHSQDFMDNPEPSTLPRLYGQARTLYTPNTLLTTWNPSMLPNKRGVAQVLLEIKVFHCCISREKKMAASFQVFPAEY